MSASQQQPGEQAYGIYQHGLMFLGTSELLLQKISKEGWIGFSFPMAVVGAFAAELLLKCLHALDSGGQPPRGHNLLELFDSLKASTKDEVQAAHDIFMQQAGPRNYPLNVPQDLRGKLQLSKGAFELFRYVYEGKMKDGEGYNLRSVMAAVQNVILARHPEWRNR